FPDYSVELSEAEREELEVEQREDVLVFTTVTVLDRKRMTTNLAAPIVININKYLARQIIIPERAGETRTPLPEHEKVNL
ncbi:MAG: flagellar assembly protein FliW, partial [Firmicutes bacterium]|nr:flagellar assembly protein FliW [Bacillota bacterium]